MRHHGHYWPVENCGSSDLSKLFLPADLASFGSHPQRLKLGASLAFSFMKIQRDCFAIRCADGLALHRSRIAWLDPQSRLHSPLYHSRRSQASRRAYPSQVPAFRWQLPTLQGLLGFATCRHRRSGPCNSLESRRPALIEASLSKQVLFASHRPAVRQLARCQGRSFLALYRALFDQIKNSSLW